MSTMLQLQLGLSHRHEVYTHAEYSLSDYLDSPTSTEHDPRELPSPNPGASGGFNIYG